MYLRWSQPEVQIGKVYYCLTVALLTARLKMITILVLSDNFTIVFKWILLS